MFSQALTSFASLQYLIVRRKTARFTASNLIDDKLTPDSRIPLLSIAKLNSRPADLLFNLVRECLATWNQIEPSLLVMYAKLVSLGFTYSDGEIIIIEQKKDQ